LQSQLRPITKKRTKKKPSPVGNKWAAGGKGGELKMSNRGKGCNTGAGKSKKRQNRLESGRYTGACGKPTRPCS